MISSKGEGKFWNFSGAKQEGGDDFWLKFSEGQILGETMILFIFQFKEHKENQNSVMILKIWKSVQKHCAWLVACIVLHQVCIGQNTLEVFSLSEIL